MGCKQITNESKKPETYDNKLHPVSNQNKKSFPVTNINFIAKYKSKVYATLTYPTSATIKSLVREMVKKVPYSSPDNKYQFQIEGKLIAADIMSEIASIHEIQVFLAANEAQIHNGQILEVTVDVICLGLDNIPGDSIRAYNQVKYLGKPLTDPFEIAIFDRETGQVKTEEFSKQIEDDSEIHLYSELSAYCNGHNMLYISGGEQKNNALNNFWSVDLVHKTISKHKKGLNHPRKFHSMIYVPNSYVFIVGGLGNKNVEYYNTVTKEIINHSVLNEERTEPALALINGSYLYAFTGFLNQGGKIKDTFERFNLRENGRWELLKPKLDKSVNLFTQRFFAVSHHKPGEVIFLGGSVTNDGKNNTSRNCHVYDYVNGEIKSSNVPFESMEFSEKFFYPFKETNGFLFPHFNDRDSLKILGYSTDKVNKIQFEPDSEVSRTEDRGFTLKIEDDKTPAGSVSNMAPNAVNANGSNAIMAK